MALFGSYAPPDVYTSVVISGGGQPLFGTARIPVIIGEGQEFFEQDNIELHRGSSAVADDQVVSENISDQLTALPTNTFQATYFPIVTGDGSGTVTDDPSKVQIVVDGIPATVISLDGATGSFTTQELLDSNINQNVELTYYFKRSDTLVTDEDLSDQVPVNAILKLYDGADTITISTAIPGAISNNVTLTFTDDSLGSFPGSGVPDVQAVSGAGTDSIHIDLRKTGALGLRSVSDIYTLVQAGIPTLDAGYLMATVPVASATAANVVSGATLSLAGGAGPNSNMTFKVEHIPVVDGTNGGVVTADTTKITVLVNGSAPAGGVKSLDGAEGLFTLASPVAAGSTLTVTYYTNTYQNTFDLLPANNVASVLQVGLGPDRNDFIEDSDFVLGEDANGNGIINWGAATTTAVGNSTTGFTPFGPTQITTTLVDEKVYLRPCQGTPNGKLQSFTLNDAPVDGSGRGVPTDDPTLVSVYAGLDPVAAFQAGTVEILTVSGATGAFTLKDAPAAGKHVYATYWRNTLEDHSYTVAVLTPGIPGQGTYSIKDELGRVLPVVSDMTSTPLSPPVTNFDTVGIVWPNNFTDLYAEPGAVDETVTLTFASDADAPDTSAGAQSTLTTQGITFIALIPGSFGDSISVAFDTTTSGPPTVSGDVITVHGALTLSQVVAQFPATGPDVVTVPGTPSTVVFASGSGTGLVSTAAALSLQNGVDPAYSTPSANTFTVASSVAGGSAGTGYLGQTYIDAATGLKFTVVSPSEALSYGYTTLPLQYQFAPGDELVFKVSKGDVRYSGSTYFPFGTAQPNNLVAIAGLHTKVATTFGADTGDTAIVDSFNKSGNEPLIGEFYFVSFTTAKTAADMAIKLYSVSGDAYAAYGQPNTVNRVSLGVQLLVQNGAQQFGVIQVPKQAGLNIASDAEFISAIQTLTAALPGTTAKASVIVPLTTSTTVHQFLSRQLITQANVRNKGEAMGFVGYSSYTTAAQAMANAKSLHNSRMIAIGNPAAGIQIINSLTSVAIEYAVSGEFMAAALAGLEVNPSNDVATTLTNQDVVGLPRLLIRYDDTIMNNMASAGLTLLVDNNGALLVRHYKSTDPSNPITSEPTCTTVTDYVCQQFRIDLKQFIGRKLVDALVSDINIVCNAKLVSLVNAEIITGYKNLVVKQAPDDPTTVDVTVTFRPMFSLLWISVKFTVTTNL